MASSSTAAAAPADTTVDIKILFQLSGSDQQHTVSGLSPSSTVGHLKSKLATGLPHQPSSHHQRLIYRGKLLARDAETLGEIFDAKAAQPHILHLVVREPPSARPHEQGQSSGPQPVVHPQPLAPPNAPLLAQSRPTQPTAAAVTPTPPPLPGAPAIPVHPQTPFDALNAAGHGMPGVPPHLIPHFQQHMHALRGLPQGVHPGPNVHLVDPRLQTAVQFGQQMGMRTPQRDASPNPQNAPHPIQAGHSHQRTNTDTDQQAASGNADAQRPQTGFPGAESHPQHTPQFQAVQNGIRHGPNGELSISYTMTGPVPHGHAAQNPMNTFATQMAGRQMQLPVNLPQEARPSRSMPNWPNMPPLGLTQEYYGAAHAVDSMQMYQDDLNRLQERVNDHISPPSAQLSLASLTSGFRTQAQGILRLRNRAQQMVNDLLLPGRYPYHNGLGAEDVSRLQSMNADFAAAFERLIHSIRRIEAPDSSSSQPVSAETGTNTGNREEHRSTSSSVASAPVTAYLLSSPSGPHAMLFNSSGIFGSGNSRQNENQVPTSDLANTHDPIIDQIASLARNRRLQRSTQERMEDRVSRARDAVSALNRELASANEALTAASSAVNNLHNTNAEHARTSHRFQPDAGSASQPVQHRGAEAPVEHRNPDAGLAQAAGNDAQDLGNILFHTFWHLWTVVKVFAFIWLFTRGMSTRRTVLLVLASLVYLAAQAGLFGDHWDRFRRHFENLIGLPQGDATGAPRQQGAAEGGQPPTPNPEALADRLMQERRARDRSWLTERLVPLERAVALFIASLYPGVGERHIQAREQQRAEQRRQREEAERAQSEAAAQNDPQPVPESSTEGGPSGGAMAAGSSGGEGSSSAVQPAENADSLRERNPASSQQTATID